MPSPAALFIQSRLEDRPVRTARGNDIIRRNPTEVPRRLRGLLLAIDGRQKIHTYLDQLDGFGDVQELMWELATLGLVEFRSSRRSRPSPNGEDSGPETQPDSGNSGHSQMDALFNDPSQMFHTFTASTIKGDFDDLVRVAQLDNQSYSPPPAAEPKQADVQRQVESLFALLESVRGERRNLKEKLVASRKYRERAARIARENSDLVRTVYLLAISCAALTATLIFVVLRK